MMPCQSYDEVPEHWMLVLRLEQYIKSVPVQMDFESKFDDNGGLSKAQSQLLALIEAHSQTGDGVHVNWLSDQLQRNIQSDGPISVDQSYCRWRLIPVPFVDHQRSM